VPVLEVKQQNRSVEFGLTMEGELAKLCSKISLTEGEKIGISVTEGEVTELRERGVNCLVGLAKRVTLAVLKGPVYDPVDPRPV
jgi:hypothetical protein